MSPVLAERTGFESDVQRDESGMSSSIIYLPRFGPNVLWSWISIEPMLEAGSYFKAASASAS